MRRFVLGLLLQWLLGALAALSSSPFQPRPLTSNETLVPRTLLSLVHAQEVQRELGITNDALVRLESFLRGHDAAWMRNRSAPQPRLDSVLDPAESALAAYLISHHGTNTLARLHQLELQGQRARALLRPEVASHIGLSTSQSEYLHDLFSVTEQAEAKVRSSAIWPLAVDTARAEQLRRGERPSADRILSPDQRRLWAALLGETRDVTAFKRTHPLVPELIVSSTWLTGEPVRLADLRGQVVIVQFYAFQCRNCQANFPIYRRWHERLRSRGVAVVGIQSPETESEKDPAKARAAAREAGFDFPILFDGDQQNWSAWGNNAWPAIYLVDKHGYLRAWWIGELNWGNVRGDLFLERIIDQLRAED